MSESEGWLDVCGSDIAARGLSRAWGGAVLVSHSSMAWPSSSIVDGAGFGVSGLHSGMDCGTGEWTGTKVSAKPGANS